MSESIKPGGSRIRYQGIFDWKELYAAMHSWFSEYKFDYYEKKHVKKPMTYGYELEFEAEGERKETGYIKYKVVFYVHAYNVEDVEVIVNGKKVHKNKAGMIIVDVTPEMILDYDDNWEKNPFQKKARSFLHKYVIRGYVKQWKNKIYYEAHSLYTKVKELMDLESKHSSYKR